MDEPNVLFLDEPTNDLDIETLTQLEDLLDGWPGSMIVISHDRFFIERTTDRVMALLGDRALRMLPRGIDEYLERRQRMEEESTLRRRAPPVLGPRRRPGGLGAGGPRREEGTAEGRAPARQALHPRDQAARPDRRERHRLREGRRARRRAARTRHRARRVGDALAGTGRGRLTGTAAAGGRTGRQGPYVRGGPHRCRSRRRSRTGSRRASAPRSNRSPVCTELPCHPGTSRSRAPTVSRPNRLTATRSRPPFPTVTRGPRPPRRPAGPAAAGARGAGPPLSSRPCSPGSSSSGRVSGSRSAVTTPTTGSPSRRRAGLRRSPVPR